jgi:putative membrane protein
MRPTALLVFTLPLLLATPALAQSQAAQIDQNGRSFLDFAAKVNQSEILGGVAAEKKAQAPAVAAFARLMVLDHMELESQLSSLADMVSVQLPSGPSEQANQEMSSLKGMSGAQFDAQYMQDMVKGHEQAVQKFEGEQSKAQNPAVAAYTATALPILKQHLAVAKAIESQLNPAKTASQ